MWHERVNVVVRITWRQRDMALSREGVELTEI